MQEVYRLETETGKWIETTKEHPYLVKEELLVESNVNQKANNHKYPKSNSNLHIQLNKFFIFQHSFSVYTHENNYTTYPNLVATRNANMPNKRLDNNGHNLNL